ncbi:MAG: hypothetical protein KGI67_04090 [Pseudomonadota bacterium]|nr:hypothetical protein [Pseudomonadota bacterium]
MPSMHSVVVGGRPRASAHAQAWCLTALLLLVLLLAAAGGPSCALADSSPPIPSADDGGAAEIQGDAIEAAQPRPLEWHNELVVGADLPRELVWDSARHAGALAVQGRVLILAEMRDPGGVSGALRVTAVHSVPRVARLGLGHDDGTVYASSTTGARLHAIDLGSGAQKWVLAAGGPRPELVFHHPALHSLASFNAGANTITVFETGSRAFEGLIPLGDAPVAVRLAPDGRVLALLPERRELVLVGLRPLRIYNRWQLPVDCLHPLDLDVDPVGQRALLACGGVGVAVFDLREAEWRSSLTGSASTRPLVRAFWDGAHARVIAVAEDGDVSAASGDPAAVVPLAVVPVGSVLDFDAAGNRLVWAVADPASGVRVGFAPLR